jgi:hypothetical protein
MARLAQKCRDTLQMENRRCTYDEWQREPYVDKTAHTLEWAGHMDYTSESAYGTEPASQ